MEKLSITSISKNFFRTTPSKVENNQTNPFGVSFKGNVLTADVFENSRSKEETNLIARAANKSRMLSSAVVGSINNFGNAISSRLNSVVSFGNRIRDNVSNAWNNAKSIEISLDLMSVKNILNKEITFTGNRNSVDKLSRLPISDLEAMMENELNLLSNASESAM